MNKRNAILNFAAVHSYLLWKYENYLTSTLQNLGNGILQLRLYFDPEKDNEYFILEDIQRVVMAGVDIDVHNIDKSSSNVILIQWPIRS